MVTDQQVLDQQAAFYSEASQLRTRLGVHQLDGASLLDLWLFHECLCEAWILLRLSWYEANKGGQVAFQGREDLTTLLGLLTESDNIFDQLAAVDRNNRTSQQQR